MFRSPLFIRQQQVDTLQVMLHSHYQLSPLSPPLSQQSRQSMIHLMFHHACQCLIQSLLSYKIIHYSYILLQCHAQSLIRMLLWPQLLQCMHQLTLLKIITILTILAQSQLTLLLTLNTHHNLLVCQYVLTQSKYTLIVESHQSEVLH